MNKIFHSASRILFDKGARHSAFMLIGILFNSSYAIWNLLMGISNGDSWLVAVAAFYSLAPVVRFISIDGGLTDGGRDALFVLLVYVASCMSWLMLRASLEDRFVGIPRVTLPLLFPYAAVGIVRVAYSLKRCESARLLLFYSLRLSLLLILIFNLQSSLLSYVNVSDRVRVLLNTVTASATSLSLFYLAKRSGAGYSK